MVKVYLLSQLSMGEYILIYSYTAAEQIFNIKAHSLSIFGAINVLQS